MPRKKTIFKPLGTGYKPDLPDSRDASWDRIFGAVATPPPPVFTRPVPSYIPFQDSINCCVWATAAASQEWCSRQENHDPRLSFRYGYANTPGGTGGRGYRESADWLKEKGIPEDQYCINDWQVGANKFLDVSFVIPAGIENAEKYRIKNYSFVSTNVTSLKSACFRHPIWLAIPGIDADWKKPVDEIIQFTGDINSPQWYHSVLLWDWTEYYIGVLNWWGDRYRKISINYPFSAALSTEDLPDNWKELNMIVDQAKLNQIYNELLFRDPDPGAQGYIGQEEAIVRQSIGQSEERHRLITLIGAAREV